MNEIIRIHIAGVPYEIDADAKKQLNKYMDAIKESLGEERDALEDIEIRVTEILSDRGVNRDDVIRASDVKAVREQLGEPQDFASDEKKSKKSSKNEEVQGEKKYFRDTENSVLGGVLAGFAAYTGWDVTLLRIVFVLLAVFSGVFPFVILYIVVMMVAPEARTAGDRLSMKGEPVNIETIKESAKDFADKAGNAVNQASAKLRENGPQVTNVALRIIMGFFGLVGLVALIPCLVALIPVTILTIIYLVGVTIVMKPLFVVTVALGFVLVFTILSLGISICSALITARFGRGTLAGFLTSVVVAIAVITAACVTGSIWMYEVGRDGARDTMQGLVEDIRMEVRERRGDRVWDWERERQGELWDRDIHVDVDFDENY